VAAELLFREFLVEQVLAEVPGGAYRKFSETDGAAETHSTAAK
jgi:hypothetical protein